jgi:hypothetical protein
MTYIYFNTSFALGFARALKILAVCFGLLGVFVSILSAGKRTTTPRNSSHTFAKNFLMCAHKSSAKLSMKINLRRLQAFGAFSIRSQVASPQVGRSDSSGEIFEGSFKRTMITKHSLS